MWHKGKKEGVEKVPSKGLTPRGTANPHALNRGKEEGSNERRRKRQSS